MEVKLSGTALSIIAPVIVSAIGGAFFLGHSINSARVEHLNETVNEYRRSSQLDAPELISSLTQSADALRLTVAERQALGAAKARVDQYASRLGECKGSLSGYELELTEIKESFAESKSQCTATIHNLKTELSTYLPESTEIKVQRGVAADLIPNQVMIGLESVYDSRAVFNVDSRTIFLDVGDNTEVTSGARRCNLWLKAVDRNSNAATLKLNCPIEG